MYGSLLELPEIFFYADEGYELDGINVNTKIGRLSVSSDRKSAKFTYSYLTGPQTVSVTARKITYDAQLSPDGKTFDEAKEGYSAISPQTFTIESTGNHELTNLDITLTGTNASSFMIDTTGTTKTLDAAGGAKTSTSFKINPMADLAAGNYTANIKVTADNLPEITKEISFTVTPKPTCSVTLPIGIGYTMTPEDGSTSPVTEGDSYSFKLILDANYEKGIDFAVKANDVILSETNGVYTIKNITAVQTVSVEGVVLKPAVAEPDSPQTGDNSNMSLWIALLLVSGGVLTVLGVTEKRRKRNS